MKADLSSSWAVEAYFQQFEKEQGARLKVKDLKAAPRRKERALALQNRTPLLGVGEA
jgi:hypothetical protein